MEVVSLKQIFRDFSAYDHVRLVGWVRSNRDNGSIGFISFTDGSCIHSVQLVYKNNETQNFNEAKDAKTGSAVFAEGIVIASQQPNQKFEIKLTNIAILKQADSDFPLQKKAHSSEFLRSIAHLRHRTNKFGTIMRLRSELAFAVHNFFHQNNFVWVSAPIISTNDCEGAGANFGVITQTSKHFFVPNGYLTVSGQLHAEAYAQGFKRVYTFAPTFRAEKSNTSRHLAEFWMIEPEIAFCELNQLMELIEEFVKYLIRFVLKNCKDEMSFLNKLSENKLEAKLMQVIEQPYAKISYKQAIGLLKTALHQNKGHFENKNIYFGMDLNAEHEKYLCDYVYKAPLFIYDFPAESKPFYMKLNNDGTTVAACDLLLPQIGEIVGGSERESDYHKLYKKSCKNNIKINELQWYLDLRKYGYFKSAGFGLGFERLLMYVGDLENIKDAIPFPRSYGELSF